MTNRSNRGSEKPSGSGRFVRVEESWDPIHGLVRAGCHRRRLKRPDTWLHPTARGITDFPLAPEGPLIKPAAVSEKTAAAIGESALELLTSVSELRYNPRFGIACEVPHYIMGMLLMLRKRRSKRTIGDMAADGSSFRITSRPSVSPRNAGILDFGPWMREKPDDGSSCRRNPGNVGLEGREG
jgi:hypothetical protein